MVDQINTSASQSTSTAGATPSKNIDLLKLGKAAVSLFSRNKSNADKPAPSVTFQDVVNVLSKKFEGVKTFLQKAGILSGGKEVESIDNSAKGTATNGKGTQNMHSSYKYNEAGKITSQSLYSGKDTEPFEKYQFNESGQLQTRIQYQGEDGQKEEFGRWERAYASPEDKFCTTESFTNAKSGIKYSESTYDPQTGEQLKTVYFDQETGEKDIERSGSGYVLPEVILPE